MLIWVSSSTLVSLFWGAPHASIPLYPSIMVMVVVIKSKDLGELLFTTQSFNVLKPIIEGNMFANKESNSPGLLLNTIHILLLITINIFKISKSPASHHDDQLYADI